MTKKDELNVRDNVFQDIASKPEYLKRIYLSLHPEDGDISENELKVIHSTPVFIRGRIHDCSFIVRDEKLIFLEVQNALCNHLKEQMVVFYASSTSTIKDSYDENQTSSEGAMMLETEFWILADKETQAISDNIIFDEYQDNIVDLTEEFSLIKSQDIEEKDVKQYIEGLFGQVFDTSTSPLQIQITNENKAHIVKSNILLEGNRKTKHDAALMNIERIINQAKKIERDGTVDLSHNTRKQTLLHKSQVAEYVYFETPLKINDNYFSAELATERRKGQREKLLDLYNVKVKKKSPRWHAERFSVRG